MSGLSTNAMYEFARTIGQISKDHNILCKGKHVWAAVELDEPRQQRNRQLRVAELAVLRCRPQLEGYLELDRPAGSLYVLPSAGAKSGRLLGSWNRKSGTWSWSDKVCELAQLVPARLEELRVAALADS
jgi:hypothetical protein